MTTNHTPGPWSTHLVDDTIVIIPRRPLPQQFSTLGHSEVADEEDFANARLIAAAPELLKALEAIVNDPYVSALGSLGMRAKRVIAKARGEQ